MATVNYRFLTTSELFEKYPQIKNLGWNETNLNLFVSSYLLLGFPRNSKRHGRFEENSLKALIKFTNELSKAHIIRSELTPDFCDYDFLTPSEIVDEYENLVHLVGWDATKLGKFLRCRLLMGKITTVGRSNLITRRSFNLLIDHSTSTIERRVILINRAKSEFL